MKNNVAVSQGFPKETLYRAPIRLSLPKSVVLAATLVLSAHGHAAVVSVVPNAFASDPGTGMFFGPLANSPRTYLLLIAESQLVPHQGNLITSISFRLPITSTVDWPSADVAFTNYDIRLSDSVDPANRSLTFADNIVGSQTLVRSGALSIAANAFTSGDSPNTFGLSIDFDDDYLYDHGNLLIEIRHTGFTGTSSSVDAITASGGQSLGYGSLFSAAWTGSYTAISGSQGNFSIMEITSQSTTSVIPEPSGVLALALLLGGGVMLRPNRKKA